MMGTSMDELNRRQFLAQLAGSAVLLSVRDVPGPAAEHGASSVQSRRIVNIYNFVRNSDPRVANSEDILYEAAAHQLALLQRLNLPGTFALQYDALINPRYQRLFKTHAAKELEIGAWLEIPRALVEKAGLPWRGPAKWQWDWHVDVDFTIGYTPDERKRIADVYMAEFKRLFGKFPATVGAWYIDEITLAHLAEHYGIVASCNCKDQAATDGYTLWGGYWSQAYYPSRVNAYMPAQNRSAQIDVPIFRMLGSDPIYQYQEGLGGDGQGVITLETIYSPGGRSRKWVQWFLNVIAREPCLAFAYAQAGQENSFGWPAMKQGIELQFPMFAHLAAAGALQGETLEQSGRWFKRSFAVTPATSVVALSDWKHQGRRTLWYDSRFYRANMYWRGNKFKVRDIHIFNENVVSPYHQKAADTNDMAVYTLPIIDGFLWSSSHGRRAGIRLVALGANGQRIPFLMDAEPSVTAIADNAMGIRFPIKQGGTMNIVCEPERVAWHLEHPAAPDFRWAMEMTWSTSHRTGILQHTHKKLFYRNQSVLYAMVLGAGTIVRPKNELKTILLMPQEHSVIMAFSSARGATATRL